MTGFLKDRPWIWIIVAFAILIASWIVLLNIAGKNQPEKIEIEPDIPNERVES